MLARSCGERGGVRGSCDNHGLADSPLTAALRAATSPRKRGEVRKKRRTTMANDKKDRVGIVGAGRMGHAQLKHLVKHGYSVTACDLSADGLAKARAAGAQTADSPAALAKQTDFVILGVGYTDEVHAVVYGDGGLLANLPKG